MYFKQRSCQPQVPRKNTEGRDYALNRTILRHHDRHRQAPVVPMSRCSENRSVGPVGCACFPLPSRNQSGFRGANLAPARVSQRRALQGSGFVNSFRSGGAIPQLPRPAVVSAGGLSSGFGRADRDGGWSPGALAAHRAIAPAGQGHGTASARRFCIWRSSRGIGHGMRTG